MSLVEYTNRKVDLLAFQGPRIPGRNAQMTQSLFNGTDGGMVVAGIDKLIQRWLIEFLTEVGSLLYLPERGSTFMRDARLGRLQTEADIETAFLFAATDVDRNLKNEEDDTWFDDERLDAANLLSITLTPQQVSLNIEIRSLAGDSRRPIVPVNIVP